MITVPNCTFRPAVPGDEELILSFIRALADYEKMSDQVVATPELLREWLRQALLKELARIAVERGCGRLEWWCLDWNKPSIDFYTKGMHAVPMDEWTVYRLTGEALEEAAKPE